METKKCPYCSESILIDALKCKHCGEIIDNQLRLAQQQVDRNTYTTQQRKWSPGVAALLSFLIPGAGQMYKGNVGTGLLWFFITIFGYLFFIIPGIILHIICIVTAASGNPYKD